MGNHGKKITRAIDFHEVSRGGKRNSLIIHLLARNNIASRRGRGK